MTQVERVKDLCSIRSISIHKLEADLGFGNGYISGLKKGVFPIERLRKIAEYFNVSVEYLETGKESILDKYSENFASLVKKIRNDFALENALEKYFSLSEQKKNHVIELISLLSEVQ